ncbi:hypothetical protein M9H77_25331 [Catharanthus roseus]|uniref:Uncharacterized protein n=1 Tax=Catharanthus roseus TaxID=4058 RepID=A0ACC0A961_CATRO|nr:hypothetical protein M9H77_25331 [Catharanthus roseus]
MGQQKKISNIQQQQFMGQQNNLSNMHQTELGPQNSVSGLQQSQMLGTQSGYSGIPVNQLSVHMLQQKCLLQQQIELIFFSLFFSELDGLEGVFIWCLVFLFAEEMFILDSTRGKNFVSDSVRRLPLFEYEDIASKKAAWIPQDVYDGLQAKWDDLEYQIKCEQEQGRGMRWRGHEKEGEFVDERANKVWDKFSKFKEQKEHKRRTTGAPKPTDYELMLELNERLEKGKTYVFGAVESTRLRVQSQHAIVGSRPFLGDYEEHMAAISRHVLMR